MNEKKREKWIENCFQFSFSNFFSHCPCILLFVHNIMHEHSITSLLWKKIALQFFIVKYLSFYFHSLVLRSIHPHLCSTEFFFVDCFHIICITHKMPAMNTNVQRDLKKTTSELKMLFLFLEYHFILHFFYTTNVYWNSNRKDSLREECFLWHANLRRKRNHSLNSWFVFKFIFNLDPMFYYYNLLFISTWWKKENEKLKISYFQTK